MLMTALEHPEKLYPIIGILFVLLIVIYLQKLGEHKRDITAKSMYLGTSIHSENMSVTIEDLTRKIILTYPTLDDAEQCRMVRDQLRLNGLKNVDMYEGVIYATLGRLKGMHSQQS